MSEDSTKVQFHVSLSYDYEVSPESPGYDFNGSETREQVIERVLEYDGRVENILELVTMKDDLEIRMQIDGEWTEIG